MCAHSMIGATKQQEEPQARAVSFISLRYLVMVILGGVPHVLGTLVHLGETTQSTANTPRAWLVAIQS